MKGLKTLCLMQLKDRLDFSYLKSKKKTIFKVVLSILKFVLITALIYFAFYILSYLRLVSLLPGIPHNFFSVIFTIMILLSIIVCTFGLTKSLYFAKDNFVLLTMPVGRTQIFVSKLIVFAIYEFLRNLYYMLPLFLAYAFINTLPIYFYAWLPFAMIVVTIIPVVFGALISIPMLYIQNFIKSYKWLEYIFVIIAIGGVSALLILLINAIPENFDLIGTWGTTFWEIQRFITNFNKIFVPFIWIATAMVGTRYGISNNVLGKDQWLAILVNVAVIAVVAVVTFLIVRPLYFHMASSPFEYKKSKITKEIKNKKRNAFSSTILKDMTISYRTPEKFYSLIALIIGLPLAIFLLNKIYSAMDTRLSGTNMAIAFNVLLILLIVLSSNTNIAHIYSEEGGAGYLFKTNPKPHLKSLLSKLSLNFFGVSISLLVTIIIFASFLKLGILKTIFIYLSMESLYVAHMLWSAELDVMNPQTQRYKTEGMDLNNPNDLKSVIYAFLISSLIAFVTYFLITENMNVVWYKIFVISVLFLTLRIWLFVNRVNVYFKEKE